MDLMTLRPGEDKLADCTAPFSAVVFPSLELIMYTGILWGAIGWVDTHVVTPHVHNGLVVLWVLLLIFRFIVPVFKARRRRFIVTNTRVIVREGSKVDSIPLTDIARVDRHKGGLTLAIHGYSNPLYFSNLAKTRKLSALIDDELGLYGLR